GGGSRRGGQRRAWCRARERWLRCDRQLRQRLASPHAPRGSSAGRSELPRDRRRSGYGSRKLPKGVPAPVAGIDLLVFPIEGRHCETLEDDRSIRIIENPENAWAKTLKIRPIAVRSTPILHDRMEDRRSILRMTRLETGQNHPSLPPAQHGAAVCPPAPLPAPPHHT